MVIPQISLPIAFAIGLAIGVLGYFGQETLIRRRSRRRLAGGAPPAGWGPTNGDQAPEFSAPPPEPGEEAPAAAAPPLPGPLPPSPPTPTSARATHQARTTRAARPKAPATEGRAGALTPVAAGELADRRQKAAAAANLARRETSLEAALEALLTFVEGEPSRAAAKECASAIDAAMPRAGRSSELRAFLLSVGSRRSPSALQDDAEQVGIQMARQLKRVKTELSKPPV